MNTQTRNLLAGIALLLIGLSLIAAVNLTAPRTVRANPGVLYAAPAAQGSGNCSSWANACTLQTALAQAVSGDEIWVKAGVHYPGAAGNRTATFTLKDGVALYGGFAGTETNRDQRDWQTNVTILSGDIDQNDNHGGDYINENASQIVGNNAYHVITGGGTDATAVLDGFIVTAGQANYTGGGVYSYVSSPTLRNIIITGNYASLDGGGLYTNGWVYDPGGGGYVAPSNPALTNVAFRGNSANAGGGMYIAYATPFLADVTFSGNSASSGGGMYNAQASPSLTGVTFVNNSANSGGGMYNFDHSSPMLTNVVFIGNTATDGCGMYNNWYSNAVLTNVIFRDNHGSRYGGGIFNQNSSNPTLTNVIFSSNWVYDYGGAMYNTASHPVLINVTFNNNDATYYGGGIYNSSSNPILKNVILWGNAAANGASIYNNSSSPIISYSDIQGCDGSGSNWNPACGTDGGGNIDADPLFVDAANGNLRVGFGSPAIDAGNNTNCPSADLDDLPRPTDGNGDGTPVCDMGAYEAGTMICGVSTGNTYTFGDQSGVSIFVATQGGLDCFYVDEMGLNHPNATPGLQTGRYWLIRGLQVDKQSDASGFTVNLTLPTSFTPDTNDKVCRYTGSGQVWDCKASGYTSNTITRDGVSAFSDWAAGNNVGPTAITLLRLSAYTSRPHPAWLMIMFVLLAGMGLPARQATRLKFKQHSSDFSH